MNPKLVLITDPSNGDIDEDEHLEKLLSRQFNVQIIPFKDYKRIKKSDGTVLIRNIFPNHHVANMHEYRRNSREMRQYLSNIGLHVYNDLSGSGDVQGKDYLLRLFREGYPVIPTIDRIEELEKLPMSNRYVVKPKDGLSSIGLKILTRQELLLADIENDLIQPYIEFTEESCFFFIDKSFQYAIKTRDRRVISDITQFIPSKKEIATAESFVRWNKLRSGIQRVDFCRTKQGRLLLMELEDDSPYLFLSSIDRETEKGFISALVNSLKKEYVL